MIDLDQMKIAYLAGLVDGEGSLECQKEHQKKGTTTRFVSRLAFCFATPEPLMTISVWLGTKVLTYPALDETRSPRYRMNVTKNVAIPLIEAMVPHLILKRREAELILAIEAVRRRYTPDRRNPVWTGRQMPQIAIYQMNELWTELRSLKSNKRRMDARINRLAA